MLQNLTPCLTWVPGFCFLFKSYFFGLWIIVRPRDITVQKRDTTGGSVIQRFSLPRISRNYRMRLVRLGAAKKYGLVGAARGLQLKIKRLSRFSRFHIFRKSGSQKFARAISKSTKKDTKCLHRSIGLKNDRQRQCVRCLPHHKVCSGGVRRNGPNADASRLSGTVSSLK